MIGSLTRSKHPLFIYTKIFLNKPTDLLLQIQDIGRTPVIAMTAFVDGESMRYLYRDGSADSHYLKNNCEN
jgi:hypothetical protein